MCNHPQDVTGLESFIQLANIHMDKIVSSNTTTVNYFESP